MPTSRGCARRTRCSAAEARRAWTTLCGRPCIAQCSSAPLSKSRASSNFFKSRPTASQTTSSDPKRRSWNASSATWPRLWSATLSCSASRGRCARRTTARRLPAASLSRRRRGRRRSSSAPGASWTRFVTPCTRAGVWSRAQSRTASQSSPPTPSQSSPRQPTPTTPSAAGAANTSSRPRSLGWPTRRPSPTSSQTSWTAACAFRARPTTTKPAATTATTTTTRATPTMTLQSTPSTRASRRRRRSGRGRRGSS
mmetsp:Transcript_1510/g.4576  ORF Transcript_1510/g.4576 Transcript_1510/m.4576 type:complete len:254 (-) Transcript_1510:119-880(-)